jgi:hypothetical protein
MNRELYYAMNEHRLRNGISMAKFARILGVTYDTCWNTLTGRTEPADYNLVKFARYYDAHKVDIDGIAKEVAA